MIPVRADDRGVSPVVATLLMIGLTVSLAGSVYVMTIKYSDMAEGKPEIFVCDMEIDVDGVIEVDANGRLTGHTFSALMVSPLHRMIDWANYKVTLEGEMVFTVPDRYITSGQVPDASDDPGPTNSGRTIVGDTKYLTEEGLRNDFNPLKKGGKYDVVIVNIKENRVVWSGDVKAK
ncbi:MAG: archaellin/type IV pilin N-terminal domain-containing protein [Thermoplasmatota archaeon]